MRINTSRLFTRIRVDTPAAFIVLFTLDAACRALLLTIVPQQAYQLLGSAKLVTLVYVAASLSGLAASLVVPIALLRWSRRKVVTVAVIGTVDDAWLVYGKTRTCKGALLAWKDSPMGQEFKRREAELT